MQVATASPADDRPRKSDGLVVRFIWLVAQKKRRNSAKRKKSDNHE